MKSVKIYAGCMEYSSILTIQCYPIAVNSKQTQAKP